MFAPNNLYPAPSVSGNIFYTFIIRRNREKSMAFLEIANGSFLRFLSELKGCRNILENECAHQYSSGVLRSRMQSECSLSEKELKTAHPVCIMDAEV